MATNPLPRELLHDPPRAEATVNHADVNRLVERIAGRLVSLGMPRMPARVLVTILASPDGALTAAEIGKRLSVSPAAVSKAVQYLLQTHLAHREYVPGSRRDLYRVGDDHYAELMTFRAQLLKLMGDDLAEAAEALGGTDTPAGARVDELRDFYQTAMDEALTFYDRWRAKRDAR
jgi:predicted transcriptional regulator